MESCHGSKSAGRQFEWKLFPSSQFCLQSQRKEAQYDPLPPLTVMFASKVGLFDVLRETQVNLSHALPPTAHTHCQTSQDGLSAARTSPPESFPQISPPPPPSSSCGSPSCQWAWLDGTEETGTSLLELSWKLFDF